MQTTAPQSRVGRPPESSPREIEVVALRLFAEHGFDATTLDDVAAAVGLSRRTLFRYFASKNDIVWGDFGAVTDRLRALLDAAPRSRSLMGALRIAVVASNSYPVEQLPELRTRMTLITSVPSLQAHSMLRYAAWRSVVADFAAERLGGQPDELLPQTIGHAALGASMAAFRRWVEDPEPELEAEIDRAYRYLERGFRELA